MVEIKILIEAGNMKPNPSLSQKLGPLGINIGKVIAEVNKATQQYKGLKVPVVLDIIPSTKEFSVKVLTPSVSELLKKEIGVERGSPEPNKVKIANVPIEVIIKVAKQVIKEGEKLKSKVKEVLGSCLSLGILVESKEPIEVSKEIEEGKYDKEIEEGKEKASEEKLKKLEEEFEKVRKAQEAYVKELEKKKEEKEAPTSS